MDESVCRLVNSRGIIKWCDRKNRILQSSTRNIDPDLIQEIDDYTIVHVCSFLSIDKFCKKFVPELNNKIIMVTNDCDMDAPIFDKPVGVGDEIDKNKILDFINDHRCVHWFTQNCTLKHKKVTHIPIGIDFHTNSHKISPVEQEKIILNIAEKAPSIKNRLNRCYGNFHFNMQGKYYTDTRVDCYNKIPQKLIDYESHKLGFIDCWEKMSNYAFIPSPPGMGLDCHRTWEALTLGCIPILKRMDQTFDKMFDDLPVLMVGDWSDVNEELLSKTLDDFSSKKFNMRKLLLQYWINKIYSYKNDK